MREMDKGKEKRKQNIFSYENFLRLLFFKNVSKGRC
jgi:hypothetical protein